jgi:hypothetical protein
MISTDCWGELKSTEQEYQDIESSINSLNYSEMFADIEVHSVF